MTSGQWAGRGTPSQPPWWWWWWGIETAISEVSGAGHVLGIGQPCGNTKRGGQKEGRSGDPVVYGQSQANAGNIVVYRVGTATLVLTLWNLAPLVLQSRVWWRGFRRARGTAASFGARWMGHAHLKLQIVHCVGHPHLDPVRNL